MDEEEKEHVSSEQQRHTSGTMLSYPNPLADEPKTTTLVPGGNALH